MCKTRFGSQGVILDVFKQKNWKTLMELDASPVQGRIHFKFPFCFLNPSPMKSLSSQKVSTNLKNCLIQSWLCFILACWKWKLLLHKICLYCLVVDAILIKFIKYEMTCGDKVCYYCSTRPSDGISSHNYTQKITRTLNRNLPLLLF